MSSTVIGLPSISTAYQTLKGLADPLADKRAVEESKLKWEQLCLAALSYGTDYSVPTLRIHAKGSITTAHASEAQQRPKLKLKIRANKALSFFIDVIASFDADIAAYTKLEGQSQQGRDKTCKNQSYLQQIDPVRLILVDALWIVGQFLVPPDTTYSISSNDDTSTTKSNQSNKVITQNMDTSDLSNRNTSLVDTQVDQRPSLSLEEEEEMREDSMVAFTYIVQGLAGLKVDPMPVSASARSNASASLTPTLSPHLLQMLLDPYQLSKAAIVPHEQFIRKYRKYQTNILYRQRRFNLLIEESEGWAKILALLSSLPSENDSAIHVLEQLRGYIGAFDLDPNRLLSILVDVLELELDRTLDEILKETSTDVDGLVRQSTSQGGRIVGDKTLALLLKLINDFKVSALPHLLGFKFQNLSTSNSTLTPDDKTHKDIKEAEPLIEDAAASSTRLIQKLKPFYNLTAFLVAHKVVSLEELFPYFAPRADTMTSKVDDRDTSSNVSNQAVLSDVSAPLILREWTKAKQKEVAHDVRSWGLVSLNASNTNTTEVKTSDETSEKRYLQVDKEIPVLVLLESLLSFGAWDQFAVLLELCRFPPPLPLSFSPSQKQKLEATSTGKPSDVDVILLRPTIGKVLCEFLHFLLDPWCRSSSMSPPCLWSNAKVSATFTKLTEAAGQWPFKAERCKGFSVKCFNQFIPVTSAVKNLLGTKNEESRLIDYLFEPIMVLASSHEAVLDATLYLKICRLFQSLLERDFEEPPGSNLSQRAKTIFQHYLLPAQSLYPANPQLSFALWSCLKLLPYTIRYSLYDAWAQGPRNYRRGFGTPFPLERNAISKTALTGNGCMNSDKSLWAVRTEVMAGKETRSVLKRLAKETILEQSRRFAKVSCTSPIVAFSILIQQMQAYDNMIDLMVDSFRLCSDLSRDVLVWCLLQNLASFDGSKLDITTTQLLTSIETFTGTLYRTFPFLEVRGIFDWLLSRLVASGPVISATLAGLGVIRSLLTTAGGLEMVGGEGGAVSGQQLEGRAGSQLLRRETVSFGIVDRVNPVASTSLLGILLSPIGSLRGNNIGVALLIRLAQLRLKVLFDSNLQNKDVMQLGKTCDSIQTTQLLLLEFLSTPRDWKESEAEETIETYSSNIPSLEELLDRKVGYGIDAAAAFAIVRPCIRAALMAEEAILEKREQEEAELLERGESRHSGGRETEGAIGVPTLYKRWLPSAPEIRRVCQSLIPCRFQNSISCTLYCTFWSLDLFDLYVPKHRYTVEINRLNKEEERLKQKRVAASETLPFTPKDAAELHRVAKNAAKLKDDQLKQIDHCKFVKSKKFEADIDKFFSCRRHDRDENEMGDSINVDNNDGGNFESSAKAFLTICIFPRALSSPDAAFYCAHFVQRLHNMNTPRFHTLQFFDHLVNATIGALMYFTEEEAQNFGILIEALWSVIVDWRYEKSDKREAENAYEREVMSKQGSFLDESSEPVTYEKYKSLYIIWHDRLGKAFLGCLEAKSKGADDRLTNLRVRSAINILTRLVRIYPTRPQVGDILFKRLKFLQEDESRPETKVMANAYVAQLTKAMLEGCWKEQTVTEKREWEEQNQKRAMERKKRAEETQKEMAAENARIDRLTEVRDSRGRGDNTRLVREWEKNSDRRRVEEKVLVWNTIVVATLFPVFFYRTRNINHLVAAFFPCSTKKKRSPPHLPDTIPLNATADTRDRDKLSDNWDRERDREYRERERGGDRGRNIEAFSDPDRRGARGVRSAHAWQVPSSSSSKAAGSGLEGRWHGTLSTALPPEKNDARDGGGKRGRSPSDDRNNSGPPEKKPKSDEDRGRAHGKARPGSIRYDSNSAGRGDAGWRH